MIQLNGSELVEVKLKKKIIIIVLICAGILTSCNKQSTGDSKPSETESQDKMTEDRSQIEDEQGTGELEQNSIDIRSIDDSEYFGDRSGCAVIYSSEEDCYYVLNEPKIDTEVSPYSTFKIVGTLMGLNNHVLEDENSLMDYNGTDYPVEAWNKNLTLKEAFQTSCVWYFRQVIDHVGYDKIERELQQLNYGNCDITEWKGSDLNPSEDLNGFWLGSSLKISPLEQVNVMKEIFQGQTIYSDEQITILKNVMLYDEANQFSIYGKTGTNQNKEGWYVGMAKKDNTDFYFAVYLYDGDSEKPVSGQLARNIVLNIFESM